MLSSESDKAKFFAKNFSNNSNHDDSGISLSVFPLRTNLKLHNISVTSKIIKKIITIFDLSKVSSPDCIPVVVLKKCEPGKRSTDKNYHPVSLLSVVSKVFEKLVNNTINHLEKYTLFLVSTADILIALSDRISRAFSRSGATRAAALDISKAFDKVWYAGPLHKLKSYGISGQIFGLVSSFLSNRQLQVILDGKSSKEYPVNPQGSILGPTLFLLHINDLSGEVSEVICNIFIYVDETTLYFKCDKASDLWQQLNCGRRMLVDFNAGKN